MSEDSPALRALKLRYSKLTSALHNAKLEDVQFPAAIRELMAIAWEMEQIQKGAA